MEDFLYEHNQYFIQIKNNEICSNIPAHKLDDMFDSLKALDKEYAIEEDYSEIKEVIRTYLVERDSLLKMNVHEKRKLYQRM